MSKIAAKCRILSTLIFICFYSFSSPASAVSVGVQTYNEFVMNELIKVRVGMEKQAAELTGQKSENRQMRLVVEKLQQELEKQMMENARQKLQLANFEVAQTCYKDSSTSYIRWGRTRCEGNASVVYKGYMAGPHFNGEIGSGSNYLCLHQTPQWATVVPGMKEAGGIYGSELQVSDNYNNVFSYSSNGNRPVGHHPVPCSLCNTPRRFTSIMIPTRTDCPAGWTKEYNGYVVSTRTTSQRAQYVCMDAAPENAPGGYNGNQNLLSPTEVICGTLPCSTYPTGYELACVVCTK